MVPPGGEQHALPGSRLGLRSLTRRTIRRAVMACPFFEAKAVYSVSATWASETQRPSWSSQMARG